MDVTVLQRQFARIGARARVRTVDGRWAVEAVAIDIARDRDGELFDVQVPPRRSAELSVLHLEPARRHLLLMSRDGGSETHKFLCGHDERHWFVAAIPENRSASTVATAMEALKPAEIVTRQSRLQVRSKDRNRRKNEAFLRQGEWFFVPDPGLIVDERLVLTREPMRRGSGKPHTVDFLYRSGGEAVYVCPRRPNGLTQAQYNTLLSRTPEVKGWGWSVLRRNPSVYVKGRVRHADHATIVLDDWHRVLMNTETQAAAMRHVAFLD